MTIRRQYSLPNCTLILEGLSDGMAAADPKDGRELLGILVNVECHFVGIGQKIHGGRIFLENLVKTVNAYCQECLSGVHHPQEMKEEGDRVYLEKIAGTNLHRLSWQPAPESQEQPTDIQLTTIQLFDLVEAVDQFIADTRTLPDLSLKLAPVPRRYRQPDEPFVQRVVPATLGIAGLAASAFLFFLIPIPEKVEKPDSRVQSTPTETIPGETSGGGETSGTGEAETEN